MALTKRTKRRIIRRLEKNLLIGYSISGGYLRVNRRYHIDFVLRHVGQFELVIKGHRVRMNSLRYWNFKTKGTVCVRCGIEGRYFRLERQAIHLDNEARFHFNLYAVNEVGDEVLMTKDHIMPKSLGGRNDLDNLQPMCQICNERKGNNEEN